MKIKELINVLNSLPFDKEIKIACYKRISDIKDIDTIVDIDTNKMSYVIVGDYE